MFVCKNLVQFDKMFSRFTDVLQSAADVLAPPPTALQDFEYHWKQVKIFYGQGPKSVASQLKCHLNDTRIPFHLEEMLQILLREQMPADSDDQHVLDFLLTTRPMDLFADLALADSPPGATVLILNWVRRFLSCLRNPCLDHESVFQPVQKLVNLCHGGKASPYEMEEILFLSTVAGLIRKEPFFIHLFLPSHHHSAFINAHLVSNNVRRHSRMPTQNTLFDEMENSVRKVALVPKTDEMQPVEEGVVEPSAELTVEDNTATDKSDGQIKSEAAAFSCDCDMAEDRLGILDGILEYFESPDSLVILRACEGALMLATLPSVSVATCCAIKSSMTAFGSRIGNRLSELCQLIPEDMNTGDIEDCTVSWGLMPRDADIQHFVGRAQLCEFLGWLDYANCLSQECSPQMAENMCVHIRHALLEGVIEPSMLDVNATFMLVLAAKIIHQLDAKPFSEELANWLVGHEASESNDCLLNIIIENAYENSDIFLPTMQFIESLLDNANERILHRMLFCYLNNRGYYDATASNQIVQTWSDEEDERERGHEVVDEHVKSRTLAPTNILKVINNYLLLLPRQIMTTNAGGTCYEEYVQDASIHYQKWIYRTSSFDWPMEATCSLDKPELSPCEAPATSSKHKIPSSDSGICEETFYEGPLLRLLFYYVRSMATHASELNLAAIAILSKLAFLPHPFLHEILLNPELPVVRGTNTLWTSMQSLARQLLLEVPRQEGFQKKVADTAQRLLTNPTVISESTDESDPIFESIVVLEEFCKELAAIAFVKYHYATEA